MREGFVVAALFGLLTCASASSESQAARDSDVVVYGATAGGVIAAIAAADEGLHVIVLEPGRHVGGMVSGGLSRTDHGNKAVIGGLSRGFYERLGKHYGEKITWYPEPSVAEKVLRDWLKEAGVTVLFGQRVETVMKENHVIHSVTMESGDTFTGRLFVDASYEGDLLARAGISYTWGREGREVYGESLAGVIEFSPSHQFSTPVSPYDADGHLLPLIYGGDPGKPGQGDRKVQAYNFRVCVTDRPELKLPFPKPRNYDPKRFELLRRHLEANPETKLNEIWLIGGANNGKYDVNNKGPVSSDHIGASWGYPEADYARRQEIWQDHVEYVQGFFYFMATDPSVPAPLQAEVNRYGLPKDEFVDTDHWPHQLYIREARRMVGEYVMTQRDIQDDLTKPDSIGMGSYNSDSHHVQRIPVADGHPWPGQGPFVLNEGDMQVPVSPYEIAYRALLPKRDECRNLFVPVCVSASHVSYSTIRMEPQYMIMGHATGVAAALALRDQVAVQDVNVKALQARLREQKAVLSLDDSAGVDIDPRMLPGQVVDNTQATKTGNWMVSGSVSPFVGVNYLHSRSEEGVATARFTPNLPAAGTYEVRLAYSADPNRASNARVIINAIQGPVETTVNQKQRPSDLPFVSLGVYEFGAGAEGWVEVATEGADGFVVADAVQWLPATSER